MTDSLRMQCELLTENQSILLKKLPLESCYVLEAASMLYASNNSVADVQKIKQTVNIIKKKTKKLSYFQNSLKIILASILSFELEPEKMLDKIIEKYSELKKFFRGSQYLPYAAYLLAKHGDNVTAEQVKSYYVTMKREKPAFGIEKDIVFATLYTIFGKNAKYTISDISAYRKELSPVLPKHTAKTVARIFVFGEGRGYAEKFIKLKKLLEENKIKFGKSNENTALALFTLLDIDNEKTEDMFWSFFDLFDNLSKSKNLFSQKRRVMYSALILYNELTKSSENKALLLAKEAAFTVALTIAVNLSAAICAA